MKKLLLLVMITGLSVVCFAQAPEVGQEVAKEATSLFDKFDWAALLTIVTTIVSIVFTTRFAWAVSKTRQAGKLLISFADAVEDKNVDANERKDLAQKARELVGKRV